MGQDDKSGRKSIASVEKALSVLNLFRQSSALLGITEIARALDLHKSTASGLVYTLESGGYLEQDPVSRKYRLGLKVLELASTLLGQLDVRKTALPYLEELRDRCDESVNLAVRDGSDIVYIERLLGSQSLGMRAEVGTRSGLHCTALGKAILNAVPGSERERIIGQLSYEALTPHTLTTSQALCENLHQTREQGYALDDEENEIGARCVASAVYNHLGYPVAAISISIPLPRFPRERIDDLGQQVRRTAQKISRALGYVEKVNR